jgi:hypothetical protein
MKPIDWHTVEQKQTIEIILIFLQSIPICTSYSGLCHLLYNLTETESHEILNSQQQICRCPGRPCDTDWTDTGRSIIKVFKNAGIVIHVRLKLCLFW